MGVQGGYLDAGPYLRDVGYPVLYLSVRYVAVGIGKRNVFLLSDGGEERHSWDLNPWGTRFFLTNWCVVPI